MNHEFSKDGRWVCKHCKWSLADVSNLFSEERDKIDSECGDFQVLKKQQKEYQAKNQRNLFNV